MVLKKYKKKFFSKNACSSNTIIAQIAKIIFGGGG